MKWQGRQPVQRRRLRRWATATISSVLVLCLLVVAGVAWYFSGVAVAVDHSDPRTNTASLTSSGLIRISKDHYAALPGTYSVLWDGGSGVVGDIVSSDATSVTRTFSSRVGAFPQAAPAVAAAAQLATSGTPVSLDSFAYSGDPRTALGLSFQDVQVPGPLGRYPAWYVPASSPVTSTPVTSTSDVGRTWVVFVHGHDSNRGESLRYLRTFTGLGLPVLVPTLRNDVGAPVSPDGADHLGDTEWLDAQAAVQWAIDRGARDVVLAGWSMGGAVSLQLVDRSPLRDRVRGLVLDSPVLDWRDVLIHQGSDRGLPQPLTQLAIWTVEERNGIDFDRFDWVARSKELTRSMLVFASDGDTFVLDGPAKKVAAARPDLVQLVNDPRADHTRTWNVDRSAYDARLRAWLTALGVVTRS